MFNFLLAKHFVACGRHLQGENDYAQTTFELCLNLRYIQVFNTFSEEI